MSQMLKMNRKLNRRFKQMKITDVPRKQGSMKEDAAEEIRLKVMAMLDNDKDLYADVVISCLHRKREEERFGESYRQMFPERFRRRKATKLLYKLDSVKQNKSAEEKCEAVMTVLDYDRNLLDSIVHHHKTELAEKEKLREQQRKINHERCLQMDPAEKRSKFMAVLEKERYFFGSLLYMHRQNEKLESCQKSPKEEKATRPFPETLDSMDLKEMEERRLEVMAWVESNQDLYDKLCSSVL